MENGWNKVMFPMGHVPLCQQTHHVNNKLFALLPISGLSAPFLDSQTFIALLY